MKAPTEDRLVRVGAGAFGATLLASAALSAEAAAAHMHALSTICGAAQSPHCGWCYAAAAFALGGMSALAAAVRPAPQQA